MAMNLAMLFMTAVKPEESQMVTENPTILHILKTVQSSPSEMAVIRL